jgi:hypothetical protein
MEGKLMYCRYETPMVVTGVPQGGRNTRYILGKRTGSFELVEIKHGGIVQAGRLVRPQQIQGDRIYHAALDGSGIFTEMGEIHGGTFSAESSVPAISEALKAIQTLINRHDKAEIKKLWHPAPLAEYALRYIGSAARQFREIEPDRQRITDFDTISFDRRHEELGAQLSNTCVACEGRLYNVEPMPFISVLIGGDVVTIKAEIDDASTYLKKNRDCVRLFGIAEKEAATAFATELAERHKFDFKEIQFDFEGYRVEFLEMNSDIWLSRIVAEHIASRFAAVVGAMGALGVATTMPFEALSIARRLYNSLENSSSASDLSELDACVWEAIDYDAAEGSECFIKEAYIAQNTAIELWKDRSVHVNFAPSTPLL